jgi:hypothetical protein
VKRLLLAAAVLAASLVAAAAATADNDKKDGFKTTVPAMLIGLAPESSVERIISTGDMIGGYMFESIPDGIAVRKHGNRTELYVNHETSRVPFPYNPNTPTESNSQNDFVNSQLSRLVLGKNGGVVEAGLAITSAENWQRFCSNYLPTQAEGFNRPIVLTNEEGIDWVKRTGRAFPALQGQDDARQIGTVVAHDVKSGETRPIWGMGRHNHENSVAIPGYGKPVVLSGDDSFNQVAPQSQVYSYIARDADAVWNDEGSLFAFVSDDANVNDYYDFTLNDNRSVSGRFMPVRRDIAVGRNPDGTDMMSSDVGYPAPPNDGTWQQDPNVFPPPGTPRPGIDGPQWVLEHWGDTLLPRPVFQFLRIEDIAYDKRPGMSNVVYLVDSGRGLAGAVANGKSTNGRVWKMVLDKSDPTIVRSLSILIEGDDNEVKHPGEIHQPDNIESTSHGLLITEDPGSQQQFAPGAPNATTARIMGYPFSTGVPVPVARVDQSLDETAGYDVDAAPTPGLLGAWESSGIVDASDLLGPGAFLVTIQAHTLWVAKRTGDDNLPPAGADFTDKREGGQLVVLRLPGWTG